MRDQASALSPGSPRRRGATHFAVVASDVTALSRAGVQVRWLPRVIVTEQRPRPGIGRRPVPGRHASVERVAVGYDAGNQFYGERGGRLRDPFGRQWMLSQRLEQLTAEETNRCAAAFFGGSG
jgi:hypothetical protein